MPPRTGSTKLPLTSAAVATQSLALTAATRSFSSTTSKARRQVSENRSRMLWWLNQGPGRKYKNPVSRPTYLGTHSDQPFPLNPLFRSQPVLDEHTKELIWKKVIQRGDAIKAVSAEMGVDVRRVAAVVRMKQIEKQWVQQNKKLALPYSKAVMSMLPKTHYDEDRQDNTPHEPVNEVTVHTYTRSQIFLPVSESRHFTRDDAARAFHRKMLSADARSPQAELIGMEREILHGAKRKDSMERFRALAADKENEIAEKLRAECEREESRTQRVKTDRYEFRFRDMEVESAGRDGKGKDGVGWRYGAPFNDRKRGLTKVPTSVP